MKKYWRCNVCNDIHYGIKPPEVCPTCLALNAYVEISSEEAGKVMAVTKTTMNREQFARAIADFTVKNEFEINPDKAAFDEGLARAYASRNRMLRDTDEGFRYLERGDDVSRTVKEKEKRDYWFLVAGAFKNDAVDGVSPVRREIGQEVLVEDEFMVVQQ